MLDRLRSRLRAHVARRLSVPEIPRSLERLAEQGFTPNLIFDVGAYHGDFARTCRAIWPPAFIACFEPQPAAVARLHAMADPRVRVHATLLGAEPRERVPFHEVETASSVLAEHHSRHPVAERTMGTVREVIEREYAGEVPELLKIDVQGYELEVLRGAEPYLPRVHAILAETNLLDIHVGVPLLGELVAWLDARGFVAYDVCGLTRRPLDGALWQADLLFVRGDSPLRSDKRWSAAAPSP